MEKPTVTAEMVREIREQSGAGVMACREALLKSEGDMQRALRFLKEQNLIQVEKKAKRTTAQGIIDCYVHAGEHLAAMVELNCETDFVARTCEFKELAHNLAMQIAAMSPEFVSPDEVPVDAGVDAKAACLVSQPFIRDPARTVQDIINEAIARTGENIRVKRFRRFELGSES